MEEVIMNQRVLSSSDRRIAVFAMCVALTGVGCAAGRTLAALFGDCRLVSGYSYNEWLYGRIPLHGLAGAQIVIFVVIVLVCASVSGITSYLLAQLANSKTR